MKLLKTVVLLLLLAVTGCKESADMLAAAHATPANQGAKEYYSLYSGANIPNSAPRGQVFEYQ
jgi:hypothetical protein